VGAGLLARSFLRDGGDHNVSAPEDAKDVTYSASLS